MVTEASGELLSRSRTEAAASVLSGSSGLAGSVQGPEEGDGRGARSRGGDCLGRGWRAKKQETRTGRRLLLGGSARGG